MTATGPTEPIRGRGRPRTNGGTHFLTVAEAAAGRGVTPYAIYWHIKQGHIRAVKQGRVWLIPRAAYEAQLTGAGGGLEGLGAALGWEREELRGFIKEAVGEAVREVFGALAQPPKEPEWAPSRRHRMSAAGW